jgi:hypothetical protein
MYKRVQKLIGREEVTQEGVRGKIDGIAQIIQEKQKFIKMMKNAQANKFEIDEV